MFFGSGGILQEVRWIIAQEDTWIFDLYSQKIYVILSLNKMNFTLFDMLDFLILSFLYFNILTSKKEW
jgi:hypothetical protein